MSVKRLFVPVLFILLLSSLLISCGRSISKVEHPKGSDAKVKYPEEYYVKEVSVLPEGFIRLKKETELPNGLSYIFWETQLSFLDAEGKGFYSTAIINIDFIVEYENNYYVNEDKLDELIEVAAMIPATRNQIFHLGDAVTIRGTGEAVYVVKITEIEDNVTDNDKTYTIKYTVNSNVAYKENTKFVTSVETKDGINYGQPPIMYTGLKLVENRIF